VKGYLMSALGVAALLAAGFLGERAYRASQSLEAAEARLAALQVDVQALGPGSGEAGQVDPRVQRAENDTDRWANEQKLDLMLVVVSLVTAVPLLLWGLRARRARVVPGGGPPGE
jgi:hypothetical protein